MLRIDDINLNVDAINVDEINIVIVGGGPAGLLATILLANKLRVIKNAKISLIDPDFGNYVRSGDYVLFVFRELEKALKDHKVPCSIKKPSYAGHIKDAERILFDVVQQQLAHDSNKIELIHGKFSTYSSGLVEVICNPGDPSDSKSDPVPKHTTLTIPCNLLIDCTGQKQVVLNEVNNKQGMPIFKKQIYEKNAHSKHLHATILMKKDYDFSFNYIMDPLIQAERKKALKDLGWPYWANPDGYINQFGGIMGIGYKSEKMNRDMVKYHFYSQVPENLKEETEILKWMKAYMGTQTKGGEPSDIKLTHPPNKPSNRKKRSVDIYDHKPSYTTPFHFIDTNNSMLIVPLGDSSFNNHIALGQGLRRAILQIREFTDSILFDSSTILLQSGRFQNWSKKDLDMRRDPIMHQYVKFYGNLNYGIFEKNQTIQVLFQNVSKYLDESDYYFEDIKPGFVKNFDSLKMLFEWRSNTFLTDESIKKLLEGMHYACKDLQKHERKAGPSFYENKALEIEKMLSTLLIAQPNQKNAEAKVEEHKKDTVTPVSATVMTKPSIFEVTRTADKAEVIEEVKVEDDKRTVAASSSDPRITTPINEKPELAPMKTSIQDIVLSIKNYLAEEHPSILRPLGSIEPYRCRLADSLIKYVIENNSDAYKAKIIALRKEGHITMQCAFKLNQLMCENDQNNGMCISALRNMIDNYYQEKSKWKSMFSTSSVIKAIEQLFEFAVKNGWNFIDQSYIDLCLKTEAKNVVNDLRYNVLREFHIIKKLSI